MKYEICLFKTINWHIVTSKQNIRFNLSSYSLIMKTGAYQGTPIATGPKKLWRTKMKHCLDYLITTVYIKEFL